MTAKHFFLQTAIVLCCAGCATRPSPKLIAIPTAVVPGFRVNVGYSAKANQELKRRSETVVVFGYPYGSPSKYAPRNLISDMGEIGLGEFRTEIQPGQVASIPTVTLDQSRLKYLNPVGVQLLINVVSGRKSSRDNLLDCGIYEGPLQPVQSQTILIDCKLIGE